MTTVKEITNYLNEIFPFAYQESYDNSGLLVGNPDSHVKGLLVTLDVTEAVIDEAISLECNVILAHHPIIFHGIKRLTGSSFEERTIIKAIQNNIAIIASHTNTDNSSGGTNYYLAKLFDLQNAKPLLPLTDTLRKLVTFVPLLHEQKVKEALFNAGAGVIGNYDKTSFTVQGTGSFRGNEKTHGFSGTPNKLHFEKEIRIETVFAKHLEHKIILTLLESHPYEEVAYDIYTLNNMFEKTGAGMIGETKTEISEFDFLKKIKTTLNTGTIRHTKFLKKPIKKIALCGGSGSFLLKNAIQQKADIYISADFKYHEFFDADNKILIADAGHFETEQFTKELIFDILTKKFNNFACFLSKVNTNPINYL